MEELEKGQITDQNIKGFVLHKDPHLIPKYIL